MNHISAIASLALALVVSLTTDSAGQSLAETGFEWIASGAEGTCQILGGDHGEKLVFTFKTGVRYAFGLSHTCPKELQLDGPVRIYRIQSSTITPGEIMLVDQRGIGWSVRKEMWGRYKVQRTTR